MKVRIVKQNMWYYVETKRCWICTWERLEGYPTVNMAERRVADLIYDYESTRGKTVIIRTYSM
jgi:hypothetical protein